ncbi:hypothetical protein O159_19500 [Leifsonia xyli subsp. cynodontis DSM 46306]|uniref:Uncharacterized protein n=1 Tax=Leifsonia xyli subsp. cynodontis DSM 46306 TaxID=1389489 RepID=U3P6M8_LEIXC|nr:hypothetical protein [Leifsonia xyli]AGW41965.1 hypothetical protein O159_19500 [Leifsonia xyli subsp. cynodontis DSM 46306]
MAEIDITPAEKREPLIINYGEMRVGPLPGSAPSELLTIIDSIPKPKVMAGKQKESYENLVASATGSFLYDRVIPADQKALLDLDDIRLILPAWMKYVKLGES